MNSAAQPFEIGIVQRHPRLSVADELLRQAAVVALTAESVRRAEVSLVLTDDPEIHRINREFLRHDYPTDVISFLLNDERSAGAADRVIDGELIVSLDTAERVAALHGWSLASEVILYVVHGLLHLCGYDDQTEIARPVMRQREREILSMLNLLAGGDDPSSAGWDDGPA